MSDHRRMYSRIYRSLGRAELAGEPLGEGRELSVMDLAGKSEEPRWLGFYSPEGLRLAFRRYGVVEDLRALGFESTRVEFRLEDPEEQMLRVWASKPAHEEPLVELVVRRGFLYPQGALAGIMGAVHMPMVVVEWLQLQNPLGHFTAERLPLPGQRWPGLGIGAQVLELLRRACKRLGLAGIVTVPSHFHNAWFYSGEFRYVDPACQGTFEGLCRDVLPACQNMAAMASWAIHWKMVCEREGYPARPFAWPHELMMLPVDKRLRAYIAHPQYLEECRQQRERQHFKVFAEPLRQMLASRGITPFDGERINAWIRQQG